MDLLVAFWSFVHGFIFSRGFFFRGSKLCGGNGGWRVESGLEIIYALLVR